MATIDEIKQQAEAVKNATQVGENTAVRVGGALSGLSDIAKQHDVDLGKKADKETVDTALGKKADKETVNAALDKKANTADVNTKFTEEKKRVDGELDKKFDKESVVQESGEDEYKVMSQKATTDAIQTAIIFDVSVYNNGAVFESISALLGNSNLSTLIPTTVRHGGMIIKFVQGSEQSSDNNYVQYMLKADLFTLDVTKWVRVGIDILIQNHTLILK